MGILRFLLALAVLFGHSDQIPPLSMINSGGAVRLFFVISGFYMALILNEKYNRTSLFYLNRALRLYPAYFVTMFACVAWFVFTWKYTGARPPPTWIADANSEMSIASRVALAVADWTMIGLDLPVLFHYKLGTGFLFIHGEAETLADGSHWVGRIPWIQQGWSLGTELWFYALAPLCVRSAYWKQAILGVASFVFYVMTIDVPLSRFMFASNLWLFVLGSLLYAFYRSRFFKPVGTHAILTTVSVLIVCFFGYLGSIGSHIAVYIMAVILPFLFDASKRSSFDSYIGEMSYPIYLNHFLVISVLKVAFKIESVPLYAIASIVAALAVNALIERPIDRLRQALASRQRPTQGAPAAKVMA